MSFDQDISRKHSKGARLTTLASYYKKQYNPQLDSVVCLAHIVNCLSKLNFEIKKSEIYYAFKKFYRKEEHADICGYLKFLYSLLDYPSKKNTNNLILGSRKARGSKKMALSPDCKGRGVLDG